MAITLAQDFYKESITVAVVAGAINIYVSNPPTNSSGYLVISPSNESKREIVKYTAVGSDGSGDYVTVTAPNRGLGGTTDQSHQIDEPIYMNVTAETIQEISDALDSIVAGGAQDASEATKGITKVNVAPASASNPIAVGINDTTQLPSLEQKSFLNGITGMIVPYGGISAPTDFLLCDGSEYVNNVHPELIAILLGRYGYDAGVAFTAAVSDVISATSHGLSDEDIVFFSTDDTLPAGLSVNTLYYVRDSTVNSFKVETTIGGGAVDITDTGTGTHLLHDSFKVPDLRSSVPIGMGQGAGLTDRVLGVTGGEEEHQLTEAELASHAHNIQAERSTGSSNSVITVANDHQSPDDDQFTDAAGGDSPHNNMQPFLTVNFIIKT